MSNVNGFFMPFEVVVVLLKLCGRQSRPSSADLHTGPLCIRLNSPQTFFGLWYYYHSHNGSINIIYIKLFISIASTFKLYITPCPLHEQRLE